MEEGELREFVLTVGNIQKSQATLVDLDYNVLELPKYLLPKDIKPGSVVRLAVAHDTREQEKRQHQLQKVQNDLQSRHNGPVNKILEE